MSKMLCYWILSQIWYISKNKKEWKFTKCFKKKGLFMVQLAEVPGSARVNLQLDEHLLFCKQFSKMWRSAYRGLGPPGPGGCWGQPCTKTFLGQVGMCLQNFINISAGVWLSISPTHTNRHTDIRTNICTPIFIYMHIKKYEFELVYEWSFQVWHTWLSNFVWFFKVESWWAIRIFVGELTFRLVKNKLRICIMR